MNERSQVERHERIFPEGNGVASAHRLLVEIENGWLTAEIICESDPDADCRTICKASECEEGCVAYGTHKRERVDYCNVREYIDDAGWQDCYGGKRSPLRSGWIAPYWEDDGYAWAYVGEPVREAS